MNRRTLLGWSSVIAATTVLLTACGSPASGAGPSAPAKVATTAPSATSTAAPADPAAAAATGTCGLVTQQEASTAIGAAAGPGDSSAGCVYTGPADETLSAVIIVGNKTEIDQVKASLVGTPGYQDIPGVGDSAFMKSGDGGGQFYCVKGTRVLMLTLSKGSGSVADALMTVGTTACGRL
jgi:hypothetical protein